MWCLKEMTVEHVKWINISYCLSCKKYGFMDSFFLFEENTSKIWIKQMMKNW